MTSILFLNVFEGRDFVLFIIIAERERRNQWDQVLLEAAIFSYII